MKPFNNDIYQASLDACNKSGVPEDLAEKVSLILGSDNPGAENLGRTSEDQALVDEALPYIQAYLAQKDNS